MAMMKKGKRKLPDPKHCLVADIVGSRFTYFISDHTRELELDRIDDEAIVELTAQISKIESSGAEHIGED